MIFSLILVHPISYMFPGAIFISLMSCLADYKSVSEKKLAKRHYQHHFTLYIGPWHRDWVERSFMCTREKCHKTWLMAFHHSTDKNWRMEKCQRLVISWKNLILNLNWKKNNFIWTSDFNLNILKKSMMRISASKKIKDQIKHTLTSKHSAITNDWPLWENLTSFEWK